MNTIWHWVCVLHPYLFLIAAAYIAIQLIQNFFLFRYKAEFQAPPTEWPQISIWVAARDEAENIGDCLAALCALDFPKENLQILVGNDQSSDNTAEIARDWAARHSFIKVIDIVDNDSGLKAKARVNQPHHGHAPFLGSILHTRKQFDFSCVLRTLQTR